MSASRKVTLRYFAWLREKVGRGEETVALPENVGTVGELMAWLRGRGPEYAAAFEREGIIRAAIDHRHVKSATPLTGAAEIAFFPPVTGG